MNIKKKILDSIKQMRAQGYTLISEDWGNTKEKCACAMSCVILSNNPKDGWLLGSSDSAQTAADVLEVNWDWIDSFLDGYDGNGDSKGARVKEAWEIGAEVAKEAKPITLTDFRKSNVK